MDALFPSLTAKTFFILTLQLALTWAAARLVIIRLRQIYQGGQVSWITASKNSKGQLDLHIDPRALVVPQTSFSIASIIMFGTLFFWGQYQSLPIALTIFSIWSFTVGILMAIAVVAVDENLGAHVLSLTTMAVAAFGIYGSLTSIDFRFLTPWLFYALLALVVFNFVRIFINMPRPVSRVVAFVGVAIFVIYLIYDFNRLAALQEKGVNSWPAAINIAIDIYLDIINLFLQLMDALSKD